MNEEFYRGGSRSPFKVNFKGGQLTLNSSRFSVNLTDPISGIDTRVKRLQCIVQLVKNPSGNPANGWVAFLRVPDDSVIDISTISIDSPQVLRPKVFVTNDDHAIYIDLFLEAINLGGTEKIQLLGYASEATTGGWACKYYAESSYH